MCDWYFKLIRKSQDYVRNINPRGNSNLIALPSLFSSSLLDETCDHFVRVQLFRERNTHRASLWVKIGETTKSEESRYIGKALSPHNSNHSADLFSPRCFKRVRRTAFNNASHTGWFAIIIINVQNK